MTEDHTNYITKADYERMAQAIEVLKTENRRLKGLLQDRGIPLGTEIKEVSLAGGEPPSTKGRRWPRKRPLGKHLTAGRSITRFCYWCMGGISVYRVQKCPTTTCYLWPFRFGKREAARLIVDIEQDTGVSPTGKPWEGPCSPSEGEESC